MIDPTGLDYQEAFKAMYPGLASEGVRLQDTQDAVLKVVTRAARLRRAERERVKAELRALAERAAKGDLEFLSPADQAAMINTVIEEIR